MILDIPEVDAGYFMLEMESGRWGLCDPKEGYYTTHSGLWDVVIEHPNDPNGEPLKFLGSFVSKDLATKFILESLKQFDYFNAPTVESMYYQKDYKPK
jgi:hypothetical protein